MLSSFDRPGCGHGGPRRRTSLSSEASWPYAILWSKQSGRLQLKLRIYQSWDSPERVLISK